MPRAMLVDTSALPSEREIAHAKLPAAYENAINALATCQRVDECKTWADKAAALASYGRQSHDDRLVKHAMRIQARATRRCGQLLEAYKLKKSPGRPAKNGGAGSPISQRDVAKSHGISKDREKAAVRAANIPADEFESAVESDDPPSAKKLSDMGKQARPAEPSEPEGFLEATQLIGALRRLAERCAAHTPEFVAGGVKLHEVEKTCEHANIVLPWLALFVKCLKEKGQ